VSTLPFSSCSFASICTPYRARVPKFSSAELHVQVDAALEAWLLLHCTIYVDIANLSMLIDLSVCVSIYKSNIQQSMPSNVHCKDHQQSIAALRGLPSSLRLAAIDSQNPITYFSVFPFSLSTCTLEVTVVICMFCYG